MTQDDQPTPSPEETIAQGCELSAAQMTQVSNVAEQLEQRLKIMTEQGRQNTLRSSAPLHTGASHD